jgi:SPP1 family phage portal protein
MIDLKEVQKLIDSDAGRQSRLAVQAAYVKGTNPPILAPAPKEEPDNRIPVPFARRAINMVLGYMFKEGNIVYSGDGLDDALQSTFDANDEGLLDLELAGSSLAHGEAWELHWTEGGGDQFAQIPISQCIAIYDDSLKPKLVGFIRHWSKRDYEGNRIFYAHVYDESLVVRYQGPTVEGLAEESSENHGYGRVPVVQFKISSDGSNLFDHVTALIDFYDKIMSEDFANELARFASSYMLMAGRLSDEVDSETGETEVDKIKQTRLFQNLAGEKSVTDQIAFLTKDINAGFIDTAADRCERLIYEMLQLFNPNDDTFVQASGVAQKYKLLGFEYLCATIATYFSIGLQDRIALIKKLDSNLSAGNNSVNTDVTITWNRNLPDDLLALSTIAATLKGILSDETILHLFPTYIVKDVDEELKQVGNNPDLFSDGEIDGTGAPNVAGNNVQATALNGAQVTSLQGIAQAVADNQLPFETAMELVQIAFPTIDMATAERMLRPADEFTPEKEPINGMQAGQENQGKQEGQVDADAGA